MDMLGCQKEAKDVGFNSMEFIAMFPAGPVNCKWLDAYMGLFQVDHPELKGRFLVASDYTDIVCMPLEGTTGCFG